MASLALFLCLVFIAWVLVRDIRRRTSVSAAIWMPTFMLLILGSRPLSMWLTTAAGSGGEGNWIDQLFYFGVIVGSWLIVFSRRVKWQQLFLANTALLVFYFYLGLSVLWSDDPGGSFKRWFKVFGLIFVVAVILSEKKPLEAMRAVFVRCACVLIPLSIVFIRYYPNLGRNFSVSGEMMYTGAATQKNSLGEIVMVFTMFLIWDYLETRATGVKKVWSSISWERLLLLLMGLWLLKVSESKTALMCMLIGLTLIVRSGWLTSKTINRTILVAALSLPFLLLLTQQSNSMLSPLVEALGRDLTFTGRTNIWQNVLADKTLNPFIGAGFFNYWGGEGEAIREVMQAPGVHSAHNGYLDTYLDGGLIALGLLFCMLVSRGNRFTEDLRRGSFSDLPPGMNRYHQVRFAVLIVTIIYNLSESNFARLTPTWFTALLMFVSLPPLVGSYQRFRGRVKGVDESAWSASTNSSQCAKL